MKHLRNSITALLVIALLIPGGALPACAQEGNYISIQEVPSGSGTALYTGDDQVVWSGEISVEQELPEEPEPAAPQVLDTGIPNYYQTDYPDVRFGSGSLATSGCSITCLAMVASYMTGHAYSPPELARYFGGDAHNNMGRLEIGSDALKLPYHKSENWHETLAALKAGKVVIALMGADSLFTNGQHFIVLAGMTEDGRILVNDPNRNNYDYWELKHGFAEGFSEEQILRGYSGGWIYDKDAMPEDPFVYWEEEPQRQYRYGDLSLTRAEEDLLARVIWVEAQGESFEGQQAVAEVVLNRMISRDFPDSLEGVIYAQGQFQSVLYLEEAEAWQVQYEAIERALYGPYVLPVDVVYFSRQAANDHVWGTIGGHVFCYGASS